MMFGRLPFAYRQLVLALFVFVAFEGVTVGQNSDYYLQITRESLLEGDCERAQRFYNVYIKGFEQKPITEIETQLMDCFESKEKEKSVVSDSIKPNENNGTAYNYKITVPLNPLYARDFEVFQDGERLSDLEVRRLLANTKSYDIYDKGMRMGLNDGFYIPGGMALGLAAGCFLGMAVSDEWDDPGNEGWIIAGTLSMACGIGLISTGYVRSCIGREKIRKAVGLYNNGQLHTTSDLELEYGLTGNGVYLSFLF